MNEWDELSDADIDRIIARVQTTPPTCLQGLACEPAHDDEWEDRVRWSIACRCGGRTGTILGYPLREVSGDSNAPDQFVGPLAFRCASCGTTTEVIDTSVHGYNAELTPSDATMRGDPDAPRTPARCPSCANGACSVVLSFGHSHFDHIEDDPSLADRAQDFFDSFACLATCAACGHEWWVAEFELA